MENSSQRLKILNRIEEYEKKGLFDQNVEDDPPFEPLQPNEVDYLKKKFSSKIKKDITYFAASNFIKKIIKNKNMIIKEINGLEYLEEVNSGAVVTCNHFNPFDNFAIYKAFQHKLTRKRRMFKIIREGNYRFPGLYGFLFRNCDTLPLASKKETLQNFLSAVDTHLQNGHYVLIYPEQAMWWNYRKVRPFKNRAFKFAAKNNVPIIPCFITMKDSDILDSEGFYVQEYYINILKPIYPDKNKSIVENANYMQETNYNACVSLYEEFYGEKLKFSSEEN